MSKYIPKTIDIYLVIVLFLIFHIYIPDKHVKQTSISYKYQIKFVRAINLITKIKFLTDDGPWMRIETSLVNILFTIINMKLLSFIFVIYIYIFFFKLMW